MAQRNVRTVQGRPASAFFRRVALHGWDADHFTFTYKYPVLRRWLAARIVSRKKILAIGSGRGELERDLARLGHHLVSLDFSFAMVRAAAMCYKLQAVVQADAHALPFDVASFDLVLLPESLGYLQADVAFREAARVLKKRGRLMITTYPPHLPAHAVYKKRSLGEIVVLLHQADMVVDQYRFLTIKRAGIGEELAEEESDLLYLLARKRGPSRK
ncbi:MAG: class I SAM-dependent methyltransferase [Candidatus Binatia bacterium]